MATLPLMPGKYGQACACHDGYLINTLVANASLPAERLIDLLALESVWCWLVRRQPSVPSLAACTASSSQLRPISCRESKLRDRNGGSQAPPHRWVATDDQVRKALLKLKAGKAADAGGWTAEALWAVARLPRCRPLMAAWVTQVGTDEQARPARQQLFRTNGLVALEKPGGGARPILMAPSKPRSSVSCSCARHGPPYNLILSNDSLG